jgi:hypothetical protein
MRIGKQIARQLRCHELVVRKVTIECFNDPIAVGPHAGTAAIRLVAHRVRVSGQVQPHGCPAFTIARRRQQTVYLFLIRIGRSVCQIGSFFLCGRREPGEIQRHTAQKFRLAGFQPGLE